MGSILKKLGYETKKHTWADMDPSIHLEIAKRAAIAPVALLLTIFAAVQSSVYSMIFIGAFVAIVAFALAIMTYLTFAYEKYVLFMGEVCDVERKVKTTKHKTVYGRATATMAVEKILVSFPISPNSQINKGTKCALYAAPNSIIEKGGDFYAVPNPLAISIISQENNELLKMKNKGAS